MPTPFHHLVNDMVYYRKDKKQKQCIDSFVLFVTFPSHQHTWSILACRDNIVLLMEGKQSEVNNEKPHSLLLPVEMRQTDAAYSFSI